MKNKKAKADFFQQNKEIFLIILFFIILQVYFFSGFSYVSWDESVYIGMAKHIYSFGKVGLWEDLRPWALPLFIGPFWKLGVNIITFSKAVILVFSCLAIYLVYRLGKEIFDKKTGLLASTILSITPVFFFYSTKILTEIPSVFFALLSTYLFAKKRFFYSGLFAGISFLTKFPQIILAVLFVISLLIFRSNKEQKKRQKKEQKFLDARNFITGLFLIILLSILLNISFYKNPVHTFVKAAPHQANILSSESNSYLYYIFELAKNNFLYVFVIFPVYFVFRTRQKSKELLTVILLVFLIYFSVIPNRQLRFSILFIPFMSILSAAGIFLAMQRIKKYGPALIIFIFLLILGSSTIVLKDISYYNWVVAKEPEKFSGVHKILENEKKGYVLTTDPIPAAYTDLKFIPFYYSVDEGYAVFLEKEANASAVIFDENFYPCFDKECNEKKQQMLRTLRQDKSLELRNKYGSYYVFVRK